MFVIDASVTLAWCFDDESTSLSNAILRRLRREQALAPSIWPLEVANGLRSAERRGRIGAEELPGLSALLLALPIRVDHVTLDQAFGRVVQLARALGLSTYDAAYVSLAVSRRLPLATADEQLARAALASGVALVEAP